MSDDQTKDKFELIKFTDSDVFIEDLDGEGFCFIEETTKTWLDYYDELDSHLKNTSKTVISTMASLSLICIRETSSISSDILNRLSLTSDYLLKKINEHD